MKTNTVLTVLLSTALSLPAGADTLVGAGETRVVTNTESLNLAAAPLQLGTGATLVFGGAAVGTPGLNEYVRTNATGCGLPCVTAYGDWARSVTNLYWAGTNITAAQTEYIYTARWLVPQDGTYSFYEHIDDADAIAVDGTVLIRNSQWNTETCTRDVALTAGWHDLEVRMQNGVGGGGIVNGTLKSGILYSPSNDLISVANQTNAFPFVDPGDGSVLRTARNGCLMQKTMIDGEATFDLTGYDMAAPLRLAGGLIPLTNAAVTAKLTVNGQGELSFGASGLDINYPPFNSDVVFSNAASVTGVTFLDQSTVFAWPTSCAWRVADGATLALAGKNLLGDGDVTLTNHNLTVLGPQSVAEDATVHVRGTDLTVTVKPCVFDSLGSWYGAAMTLTNDISLEGSGPSLNLPVNADLYLQGKITGTGTVYKTGNGRAQIREASTVVGDIICNQTILIFEASTAGDSNNTVTVNATGAFALYPAGYGSSPTEAWIKTLKGANMSGKLYVPQYQTMTVDTLEGALTLEGGNASLHIHTLGSNAAVSVTGTLAVSVDTVCPGASITLAGAATRLAVSGTDNVLDTLILSSGAIPVSGAFTVNRLSGAGTLVKRGAETLRVNFNLGAGNVQVDAGKLTLAAPDPAGVLGSRPALWLDAAAPGVFTQYQSYLFTNNFKVIERWKDCRPGAPYYGINTRGENNFQVYPYVMTNNQNHLPVVSMGSYQGYLSAEYGGRLEARRLPLSTNLAPQYVVMMFGSQSGGGAAAAGGDWAMRRAGSAVADFRNPATPILAENYPAWTNGVAVTATNTGFNGGYQILTLNTKSKIVNALGWRTDYQNAGGQNYGEVLVYTNALTDLERMTAEAYLAEKWALPYLNALVPSATVAAGAELEIGQTFNVGQLYGDGTITIAKSSDFTPGGLFRGTLQLSGGVLHVADQPAPPGPEAVPAADRSAWFDPSQTNRVVLGAAYTPTRPLTVTGLLDRESDGLYLLGTCGGVSTNSVDRRPWLAAAAGPWGETLHWLDYQNIYDESRGNTLRMMRDLSKLGTEYTQNTVTNVRTGFIVLDSSRGGGVPITYNVYADQVIRRDGQSYAAPIWGAGTTNIVRDAPTWLDGQPVNGAATGFRGTEELLSFAANVVFQAGYFGYFSGDNVATPNRERLGEIILFESALSDSTRAAIEAYLMKKWLGKARAGYSDATAATVAGSGTVTAALPQQLPALSETFTGTVALSGTAFDFTLTTNAVGAHVVTPSISVPGSLAVAAAGTVYVHFTVKPPAGTYPLITCGATAGEGFANWTLATDGDLPAGTVSLKLTGTALNLAVTSPGTLFLLQ
ncbi:MAG TPA: hypothetical protein PKM57_05495 [Kiritimatiellia bacterium]|nr:hypothetical protein [Kiritimatiellia bacterium]